MLWQCPGHEDGAASSARDGLDALLLGSIALVAALERMEQRQRLKGVRCTQAGARCPHDCGSLELHLLCFCIPTRAP